MWSVAPSVKSALGRRSPVVGRGVAASEWREKTGIAVSDQFRLSPLTGRRRHDVVAALFYAPPVTHSIRLSTRDFFPPAFQDARDSIRPTC